MKLSRPGPPFHLTYCSNIHPGESWDQVLANLRTHALAVKALVSPRAPFGLGLRLSALAAEQLADPDVLRSFKDFLAEHDLYVFTVNGFPYGLFHGAPVKEGVYRPDWLEPERLTYSDRLARILAVLLPEGMEGSISTVPGCFRPRAEGPGAATAVAEALRQHAATLWRLRAQRGTTIGLALEPEPECLLETTADAVAFLQDHVFARASVQRFVALTGLPTAAAEEALRQHLGVCLDACHAAVEFEESGPALARLSEAGIRLLKVQVSAGLRVAPVDAAARVRLRPFAESVYLHQVVARPGSPAQALRRYLDLPQALADVERHAVIGTAPDAAAPSEGDEWRVHFHVPLFLEQLGPFRTTQAFLAQLLGTLRSSDACHHFEVETYTWDVLPEEYRRQSVVDAIARELEWARAQLCPAEATP